MERAGSILDVFDHWVDVVPDKVLFTFLERGEAETARLTCRQLHRQAAAVAEAVRAIGQVGRPVLLCYPAGLDFVAAFLGCLGAGAIAVPVMAPVGKRGLDRIRDIAADCGARVLLTVAAHGPALAAALSSAGAPPVVVETDRLDPPARPHLAAQPAAMPAYLQYTSGTTGRPKGTVIGHGNLIANLQSLAAALGYCPDSRFVSWLPHYHDLGLVAGVLSPVFAGAFCAMMPPLAFLQRPARWLRAISHYRATISGAPAFAYDICCRAYEGRAPEGLDLSSWGLAACGGELVRADFLSRFAEKFADCGFRPEALFPCYGLAEATLIVAGGPRGSGLRTAPQPGERAAGRPLASCGRVAPGQHAVIVDPESRRLLPDGAAGEIWVSGPSVAQGYWGRDEETRHSFHAEMAGDRTSQRYLRTGDLGLMMDGELYPMGRRKDMLVIRGVNFQPEDLEHTARGGHPALARHSGAAITLETARGTELVIAHEAEAAGYDLEQAARAVRDRVAERHGIRPSAVLLLRNGTLPRTSSGKVQRWQARAALLAGGLAVLARHGELPRDLEAQT